MKLRYYFLLLAVILTGVSNMSAQNLQLHFDSRHSLYGNGVAPVNYLTATYEMFKPDKWGSTFMFVDFDFNYNSRDIGLVYAEIARDIKIKDLPVMAHLEYNGGLGLVRETSIGFPISNAYLVGASYPFKLGEFFMSTYLAYKLNAFEKTSNDAQWTLTWTGTLASGKLSVSGFLDVWTQNKDRMGTTGESGKDVVLLSEPQFWYNVSPNLGLGTEVELSYNFVTGEGKNRFYAIPTLAAKWNF